MAQSSPLCEDPAALAQIPAQNHAKLVVLLSIDGLRPDAIGSTTPTLTAIRRRGVSAKDAFTIANSTTLPSHAAMLSGVDVDQHGLDFNTYRPERGIVRSETIFRTLRKSGINTAMIVSKRKFAHLVEPDGVEHFSVAGMGCTRVVQKTLLYLQEHAQGFVFVHFGDVDRAGHRYGWMSPAYLNAVRTADQCTRSLYTVLQSKEFSKDSLFVVTSDHGGHGKSHGTLLDVDQRIPWFVIGSRAANQTHIRRTIRTYDTAATILYAFGVDTPKAMLGRPVMEAILPTQQSAAVPVCTDSMSSKAVAESPIKF